MIPLDAMKPGELAAYIQTHLRNRGIDVVLTGGSVVSIYSHGEYVSHDLDFVVESITRRSRIRDAMQDLGFQEVGRHFEHPDLSLLVEFPGGPLSVGRQHVGSIDSLEYRTGTLRVLSPTDCIKDRLAAYYHWNDRQALAQALLVAEAQTVDLAEIARWSEAEGMLAAFHRIEDRFRGAP